MAALIFEFGEFKLDCGRFELSRNGRSLRIERKPLELLILLAQSNGQLVSREEIALRSGTAKSSSTRNTASIQPFAKYASPSAMTPRPRCLFRP